jgi:hypothetical protein
MTLARHVSGRMALLVCTLLGGVLIACQGGRDEEPGTSPSQFVEQLGESPPLADLTAQLKEAHQIADSAASGEEKQRAAERLAALFDAVASLEETPAGTSPHVVAVRQDLAARASQLWLEHAPKDAKRLAERGLALSETPSVLRANLYIALADAEEALGRPSEARSALVSALSINAQLFEAELEHP